MTGVRFDGSIPPGAQGVLFAADVAGPVGYRVLDRSGCEQVRTMSLGVAVTVARHLGDAWLCASDGTSVHLTAGTLCTATPDRAWIATVASALIMEEPHQ